MTPMAPMLFAPPTALSVSDSSPPKLIASVSDVFAPLDDALTVIAPNRWEVPFIARSCVRPSISSNVAEVVVSLATVS